jgi:hypothetical protein
MASIAKPVLLAVVGILAVVLFLQTSNLITGFQVQNETITTQAGGSNIAPVVTLVNFTAPTLVGCTNVTAPICYSAVMDQNGWENITSVYGVLYSANAGGGSGCSASQTNCYQNATCRNITCAGTNCSYECKFAPMPWFVDNGTWTCYVNAKDSTNNATNTSSWSTTDDSIAVLLSINADDAIDFQAITPGGNSVEITENIVNCGNTIIDVQVNGTDMTCSTNKIFANNIRWNVTAGNANNTLSGTLAVGQLNGARASTYITNATDQTYWWLSAVPSNISGTCVGNVTFVTIFDT